MFFMLNYFCSLLYFTCAYKKRLNLNKKNKFSRIFPEIIFFNKNSSYFINLILNINKFHIKRIKIIEKQLLKKLIHFCCC